MSGTSKQGILRATVTSLLLLTAGAQAQTRAVVTTFTGGSSSQAKQVRNQVVKAVCAGETTCLPQKKFVTGNKPDFAAMAREDVDVVVTGRLLGPASRRVLLLEALDAEGTSLFQQKLPLKRGSVSAGALEQVASRIAEAGGPAEPEPPPVVAEPEPVPEPGPEPSLEPPVEPEAPLPTSAATQPLLAAEAGLAFIHRTLVYDGLEFSNLRSYRTEPVLLAPRLRLEAYPLTRVTGGLLSGLGVELDWFSAVLLKAVDENDVEYPTRFSRFDVGLRMNFRPVAEKDVVVAPVLGFRGGGFRVSESEEGLRLVGLPGIAYDGLRFGAAAEGTLGSILLLLRAEYIHGLDVGEIGTDAFFPEATARSFEGTLGVGYRITRQLDARLRLHYTRYGLGFSPAEGAEFQATGAKDEQVGASVMVGFTL